MFKRPASSGGEAAGVSPARGGLWFSGAGGVHPVSQGDDLGRGHLGA
jgi:hypothetical protein